MTATHLATLPVLLPNQAVGYGWDGKKLRPNTIFLPRALDYGDDGLVSTAGELAKWMTALSTGQLVSEATLRQMITPGTLSNGAPTSYGLGLIAAPYKGQTLATHSGATPGYSSTIAYLVDSHLAVVILCNMWSTTDPGLTQPLALGVANQYLPAAPVPAAIPDPDPQTAALLRKVSAQIAAGKLDRSLFTPAFQAVLTPAAVNPAHDLLAPLGPLTSLSLLRRTPDGIATYRVLYGTTAVNWQIAVDKDHKITGLRPRSE